MSVFQAIAEFFSNNCSEIITIIAVAIACELALHFFTNRLGRRAATVARLLHGAGHVVLVIIVVFWVLRLAGVDPTPIIASAGVAGLAIGFGAQTLVKDFVSGIFIIAENQYGVGDRVTISNHEGTVECLSVRSTVLRDKDGNRIYIPNGAVTVVINHTKV